VIVTDNNGCTATSSASLTEPDPITGTVSSSTNAICNTPGAATVQGNGGTPAYTYTWPATAGGVSGNTANALLAGAYQVTITDIYNCLGTVDVSIAQTGGISASVTNVTEALCAGSDNGTITLSISGGAPNYQIDWGTNNATSSNNSYTITDLGAGTYSIDITDANGCVFTLNNVEVTEPQAMTIDVINIINVECNGGATGSAEIEINGGTAPHTILYSVPGISTEIIDNLSAGTYGVTVTDNNGCTAATSFDIGETDQITVNETTADANCFGEQGNATIEVSSGGTAPFSIVWDDGVELFHHDAVPAETLFGYTITDSNGCSYQSNITISQPELLEVTLTGTNLECFNNGSGVASVAVTGGTMPYFYEWNNGILNPSISYLDAGTYSVTVTDFNECTTSGSVNISEPEEIIIEVSTEDLICGSQQGSADITISGGTLPYQTLWSTGDTLTNIDNLYANMYSVTVNDQNNCSVSTDFAIERIGEINAGIELVEGIDCYGESSGILSANSSNGATPFSYSWSNNQSSPSITSIPAGNYFVTLTDSWGCTGADQYEITQPENITVEALIDDVNCEGGSDGSIVLNLTGGSSPYMIEWSNNQITQAINNLSSGTYSVTITDSHYCEITQSFILEEPVVNLMITATVKDIDCNGQSNGEIALQATGGTSPYSYSCSFNDFNYEGQIATGLPSGIFEIMVTDNMGCIATGTVTVSEPTPIETSYISIQPSCIGNNDGYIEFTTNGGTAPYIYEWQNGTTELPYINNLMQGDYFITITDTKQCVLEIGPIILSDIEVLCLNIPNAITPNSDGVNDTWVIEGIDAYPEYIIQVFNRWGQLLYNGIPGGPKWDGTTLQGKAVPTGCYVYVINLFDGTPPITGNISVVY
jgi:gliding motility-associated-like protein